MNSDELKSLPLPQQLQHWAHARPQGVALRQKVNGVWRPVTWAEYAQRSCWFGLGLLELGLLPGQKVAVLSENREEWVFAQLGTSMVGGITAGVYPTSPAHEVEYLLALSEAPIIVCEDQEQLDKVLEVRDRLPKLRTLVVIDARGLRRYARDRLHDFEDVVELGRKFEAQQPQAAAEAARGPELDDTGLIVFTSGSTGRPKAAMMSWRGLGAAARGLNSMLGCRPGDRAGVLSAAVPHGRADVLDPHPRLRRCHGQLRREPAHGAGGPARAVAAGLLRRAAHLGEVPRVDPDQDPRGRRPAPCRLYERAFAALGDVASTPRSRWSLTQKLQWGLWYGVVLRALLNYVGLRRCRVAVSSARADRAGDPEVLPRAGRADPRGLRPDRGRGATTMQPGDASPVGTVGVPYPGIELQLADDGEILVRGDVVFRGYFHNEEATREAIDADGWLHTGDVARWEDGPAGRELRIVDRKKDIMITAGGKNITPSRDRERAALLAVHQGGHRHRRPPALRQRR